MTSAEIQCRWASYVPNICQSRPCYLRPVTPLGASQWRARGRTNYDERFERVTNYIYDHLDEDIDLQRLAEVAALSPYHWHRVFLARRGESVVSTVRRLRLHRAAADLANSARPVSEVAERAGYGEVAAFTRAFHAAFDQPPDEYRRAGSHAAFERPGRGEGDPRRIPSR